MKRLQKDALHYTFCFAFYSNWFGYTSGYNESVDDSSVPTVTYYVLSGTIHSADSRCLTRMLDCWCYRVNCVIKHK